MFKIENKTCGILILLMAYVLAAGCIQQIDFETEQKSGQLIVDGKITNGPLPQTVRLFRTTTTTPNPLSGANVILKDDQGNSEPYLESREGIYLLYGFTISIEEGRSYQLEIQLPNGRQYRSAPEIMPRLAIQDSLHYEFDTIQDVNDLGNEVELDIIRVMTDAVVPESDEPLFFKWELLEVYKFTGFDVPDPFNNPPPICYITDTPDPQRIILFDGDELQTQKIRDQVLTERVLDFTFYQRHAFSVNVSTLTRQAHEYWQRVDKVINSTGTIFDPPPASVQGNIRNINDEDEQVFGYFEAAAVSTSRIFVNRVDLPVNIANPCKNRLRRECTNCLLFENSNTDPPDWWLGN